MTALKSVEGPRPDPATSCSGDVNNRGPDPRRAVLPQIVCNTWSWMAVSDPRFGDGQAIVAEHRSGSLLLRSEHRERGALPRTQQRRAPVRASRNHCAKEGFQIGDRKASRRGERLASRHKACVGDRRRSPRAAGHAPTAHERGLRRPRIEQRSARARRAKRCVYAKWARSRTRARRVIRQSFGMTGAKSGTLRRTALRRGIPRSPSLPRAEGPPPVWEPARQRHPPMPDK